MASNGETLPNSRMAASGEIIPQEITFDICTWLPAKSVGRFRCVSKNWCSLLSDPLFIKTHISLCSHKYEEEKLIGISDGLLHSLTFDNNPNNRFDAIARKLNFEQLSDNWATVLGSCKDLVLVLNKQNIRYLINPTTLQYHRIPDFDLAPVSKGSLSKCGLGYDSVSDDYKVVSLYHSGDVTTASFVDVYSLRNDSWRSLEKTLPCGYGDDGVLCNGCLHWVSFRCYSFTIIAFDLSKEECFEIRPPIEPTGMNTLFAGLVALRGLLCMYAYAHPEIDFWMMKHYGDDESWTKFKLKGDRIGMKPLCLMSDDQVVLENGKGALIISNKEKDRYMSIDGTTLFKRSRTFVESLVSPTYGQGN